MSEDPAVGLVRSLLQHLRSSSDDWASLALVVKLHPRGVRGVHGYTYDADGAFSGASARPSGINDAVAAYTASHFAPGEALPACLLVQFDRTSGRYEVTFEDTDATRWDVTPDNVDTMAASMRPQLG
ncbi:hypothetical protein RDV89_18420 [Nocardioides zeae]|uniref:Uncharacterized protein n=1 Tax=Nocardioides imazamoxiresistens TaxID=3231893 RepID=A0ABU3Q137_9ACTN|nr:hypothetical protein [Nocardioides zeae]MDT9595069.1 hypothetical protein [Nocardioides zeae]